MGVLIRDSIGANLWEISGPLQEMTPAQVVIWGAHLGLIKAHSLSYHVYTIEFDNRAAYEVINTQEFAILSNELVEVIMQFNTFHANHYRVGQTERYVATIPLEMNRSAEYMAQFGGENFQEVVETPGVFGNLQHFLDRDMGLALPPPLMLLAANYGTGEIEDGEPANTE